MSERSGCQVVENSSFLAKILAKIPGQDEKETENYT